MLNVNELELPHLRVNDADFRRDPRTVLEEAGSQHPWLARIDAGFFFHGYQAIKDIALREEKLANDYSRVVKTMGLQASPSAKFQTEQLLGHTGEKHRRIWMSVGDVFTPRNVNGNMTSATLISIATIVMSPLAVALIFVWVSIWHASRWPNACTLRLSASTIPDWWVESTGARSLGFGVCSLPIELKPS